MTPTNPDYPSRWMLPVSIIRQQLACALINDYAEEDASIKRKMTNAKISELINHWRDMVKYSKSHFKSIFYSDIIWFKYLEFVPVSDSRCCSFCSSLNKKVIKIDDPRAKTFFPPIHIGCRCTFRSHSDNTLKREGLQINWPDIALPNVFIISIL